MLSNECWLGYHNLCGWDGCDCMCHEKFDWVDAEENSPSEDRFYEEARQWLKERDGT